MSVNQHQSSAKKQTPLYDTSKTSNLQKDGWQYKTIRTEWNQILSTSSDQLKYGK